MRSGYEITVGQVNIEGMIGIARAFLCAGARAALASLWQVKDEVHDMLLSVSSTEEELGEMQRSLNPQSSGPQGPFTWMMHSTSLSMTRTSCPCYNTKRVKVNYIFMV